MQTIDNEAFFNSEMTYLVLQIGKINDIITNCKKQGDKLGIYQYTKHRQQFIDQLNELLIEYKLKISATT